MQSQEKSVYSNKETDYILREEISKLRGQIDLLYFGATDNMSEEDKSNFLQRLKKSSDNLYELLNSSILKKVEQEIQELYSDLDKTQKEIIYKLTEIAEDRSKETGNHVKRVAEFSRLLAIEANLPLSDVKTIYAATPMHDIGKISTPDHILNKPGKLTAEEFEIMKSHTFAGYEMLNNSKYGVMKAAAIIALQHHEKWDGSGYPNGLHGNNIHINARITAIADVFDALSSNRSYKKAWSFEKIIDFFNDQKGKHFDPDLTELFLQKSEIFIAVRKKYPD